MPKTIPIHTNVHILLVKKQTELYEKYGRSIRLIDLASAILERSIDIAEDALNLKAKKTVTNVSVNGSDIGLVLVKEEDLKT